MTIPEIIEQAKVYFGSDRTKLKELLLTYKFDGKAWRNWITAIQMGIKQPFRLSYSLYSEVTSAIKTKKTEEINWHWIGDCSWEVKIILNEGITKCYDWDKKLIKVCGGTVRILSMYISDVLPCYAYYFHYESYDKLGNCFEFGPILKLTEKEKVLLKTLNASLTKKGYTYLNKQVCTQRYYELHSDCNEGNASLFDALFSDTTGYPTDIRKISDKSVLDPLDISISWREVYSPNRKFKYRSETRTFPTRESITTKFDVEGRITDVNVMRKFENDSFNYFEFDIIKEYKKRKRKQKNNEAKN